MASRGPSSPERLAANLGALDVALTAEEDRELRRLGDAVEGSRMPEGMSSLNPYADTAQMQS